MLLPCPLYGGGGRGLTLREVRQSAKVTETRGSRGSTQQCNFTAPGLHHCLWCLSGWACCWLWEEFGRSCPAAAWSIVCCRPSLALLRSGTLLLRFIPFGPVSQWGRVILEALGLCSAWLRSGPRDRRQGLQGVHSTKSENPPTLHQALVSRTTQALPQEDGSQSRQGCKKKRETPTH